MASTVARERRVAVLEQRKRGTGPVAIPLIAAHMGETGDEAIARHVLDHGPLPEVDDDSINAIVMVPFAPKDAA